MNSGNGQPRRLAIFGDPVRQSRSPRMYNALFERMGYNAVYSAIEVRAEELRGALDAMRALHLAGGHLTCPHKEAAVALLDELTPAAARAGAVNVVACRGGRLIGDNTDGAGFLVALKKEFGHDIGHRAAILGAGGSARAIAFALADDGFDEITVLNRTFARAASLAAALSAAGVKARALPLSPEAFAEIAPHLDLSIDATTPGPDNPVDALPVEGLPEAAICCDINYFRPSAPWILRASEAGHRTQGGLGMLVEQGALSLRLLLDMEVEGETLADSLQPAQPSLAAP